MISALCSERGHRLLLGDSEEMLSQLPNEPHATKLAGRYPDIPGLSAEFREAVDAVLAYSVLQHVFVEGSASDFLGRSLELLAPGGLVGTSTRASTSSSSSSGAVE
jgi:hypothetical protein